MLNKKARYVALALVVAGLWLVFSVNQTQAVPSLARQVGMSCTACHTVYPELTPFGRKFKLTGYTASKRADKPYEWPPPVAAMAQFSFTHTNKDLPNNVLPPHDHGNNNWDTPQAVSLFLAGRLYGPLGIFAQGTYDGLSREFFLDNTDIRLAKTLSLCGRELIIGATVNNNPTVQDVLNTTPAWGFPWAGSGVALGPTPATFIEGGLAQLVGGGGVYAYWNNLLYLETSLYGSVDKGPLSWMGIGTPTSPILDGVAPYWRMFLNHQWKEHSLAVGTFGMWGHTFPGDQTRGMSDHFVDMGFDAQYQYITSKHIVSVKATFIHEWQDWVASNALKATLNQNDYLNSYKVNLSYYYRSSYGTFGGTAGYFDITGKADPILYAPNPGDGSQGLPKSNGFIFEVNYLPWAPWDRAKFSLQYVLYDRFNGARTNYDGFGRNAADNNTLYLLFWLAI